MLNRPHALYYNGELIAIITNPDPYGTAYQIADQLSPDEGDAVVREIPYNMGNLDNWAAFSRAVVALGVEETIEGPKPPKGSRWVKVDSVDFQAADDGNTTHYGGEITITNDTDVDITIECRGTDRGDDPHWGVTEAVLNALFKDGVPGLLDVEGGQDYCTNWEDFHDYICQHVSPGGCSFYLFLREVAAQPAFGDPNPSQVVVLLDDVGDELTYRVPESQ